MDKKTPYLIGLAGQSCAGKNVAADMLAKRHYTIIDADNVTRSLLITLTPELISRYAVPAAAQNFILQNEDGSLNTRSLGALLFSHPALLASHEAFILPKIEASIEHVIQQSVIEKPHTPIVLNAPTLHKTRFVKQCQFILYIEAPYLLRVMRCRKRDKLSFSAIHARFAQQKQFLAQYLLQDADIIRVKNRGTPACLEKKLEKILVRKGI